MKHLIEYTAVAFLTALAALAMATTVIMIVGPVWYFGWWGLVALALPVPAAVIAWMAVRSYDRQQF